MKPAPPDPPEIEDRLWDGFRGRIGWDVGANCGQSLPYMTKNFAAVVAFEPARECIPFLSRWTSAPAYGKASVKFVPIAISDKPGLVDLVELPDKIDSGQLVTDGMTSMEWTTDTPDATFRRVACSTIDEEAIIYGSPTFIKVDVEGHEGRVLVGASHTLRHVRPDWLIEFHSRDLAAECLTILEAAQYRVEVVRHPHYPHDSHLWHSHGWLRCFAK